MPSLSFLELTASCSGLINIYLATRASRWNWLFGIITTSLYFFILLQAKLYANMGLQAVFFAMQFYGLFQWSYGGKNHTPLPIQHAPLNIKVAALLIIAALFASISTLLHYQTDDTVIYIDALTTAISLTAQWMMSRMWIEHWLLWMIVDGLSIPMYLNQHLYYTSSLYTVLFGLCIIGFYRWKNIALHENKITI